jgi:lipid A disaccharide synthetase
VIQEALPKSYRDLEEIRQAIRTLQHVVDDLPQAYRSLSHALDVQYRNNLLDPAQAAIDVEHALKSAQAALASAGTKAAELAAEHHLLLHALGLVAGPGCTPEGAR